MEIRKKEFQSIPELFEQMRVTAWKSLLKQYEESKFCDVMIRCGSYKFYSHRCILSSFSPYFKVMFSSDYSENTDDGYFVSDLSDFSENCVRFLLDFIYQKPDFDTASVDLSEFLKLLDYLQIIDLYDAIEKVARQNINVGNCFEVLEVADICRISKLSKVALAFITANIKDILVKIDFSDISQNVIMLCLCSRIFQYVNPEDAIALVIAWVQAKHREREIVRKILEDKVYHGWKTSDTMYENCLDLVLHYDSHSFYSHDICNLVENRKIDSFSALKNITFLQEQYNQQERSLYKLSFSNNALYMAAVLGEYEEEILILAKFYPEKGVFDVKAEEKIHQCANCYEHGPFDFEINGIHSYDNVLFVAFTRLCCQSCYVLQFDINLDYGQIEDPITIHVTDNENSDFTAHKNMIFVKDSHNAYCYNSEYKDLKHFVLDDNIESFSFCKGKLIGISHFPEDGVINFYEFVLADGSWKHVSKVPLPVLDENEQEKFGYFTARHFVHNDEFFIELPPELGSDGMVSQYVNVDLASNCLGTCRFGLDNLLREDYLSLPSWLLL